MSRRDRAGYAVILAISVALVPLSALADTDVIRYSESAPDNVQVDLPDAMRHAPASPGLESRKVSLEITGSTFAPSDLELQSRVAGATPFQGTGLPELGIGVMIPIHSGKWGDLSAELGTGFLQLARTGNFLGAGFNQLETEYLGVIPIHAGLEVSPRFAQWRLLSVHFGAAAEPMLAMSSRTVFDDGVVAFGVPVFVSAGVTIHLKSVLSAVPLGLRADVMSAYGNLGDGQFSGTGGALSLEVPL